MSIVSIKTKSRQTMYVKNHPTSKRDPIKFTPHLAHAKQFPNMAAAKNIRDDLLQNHNVTVHNS